MKNETIAADITRTLAARTAEQDEARARNFLLSTLDAWDAKDLAPEALAQVIAAHSATLATAGDLKRVPAPRRTLAASIITAAERIAHSVAFNLGGDYSGAVAYRTGWGTRAEACTTTTAGGQYSRRVTYRKTDATHHVTLDPLGVAALVENEPLRSASARDGLCLIALYPDGSAVWAKRHGKGIVSERGWIAGNARACYHSTKSKAHAEARFQKKLAALEKEEREARTNAKAHRRARLVARLCHGITATLADAKALGYCEPGIHAFQARHGIGETATLPQLIQTGDPSAVALALSIARKAAHRETATA